jgi:hypothetical protein
MEKTMKATTAAIPRINTGSNRLIRVDASVSASSS